MLCSAYLRCRLDAVTRTVVGLTVAQRHHTALDKGQHPNPQNLDPSPRPTPDLADTSYAQATVPRRTGNGSEENKHDEGFNQRIMDVLTCSRQPSMGCDAADS